MNKLLKLSGLTLFVAICAFAVGVFTSAHVLAHDNEDHSVGTEVAQAETTNEAPAEENNDNNQETTATYRFTAQPGDSYSVIARKSIQIYGIEQELPLSESEIIAAETWLTKDAGSPRLHLGQEVILDVSDVQAAVQRAQGLSDEAEALWTPYAAHANFNTDSVGEARS